MLSLASQAAYLLLLLILVPIPISTDRPVSRKPWCTYAIIFLNTIVLLLFVLPKVGTPHENDVFDLYGLAPREPHLLNLFSYMFLHVSLAHLLWNSAFLWLFGPSCEDAIGHFYYLILYIAGGVVAGLLHCAIVLLFAGNAAIAFAPMVGASGAISAIIGMYALRFYRSNLCMIWGCARFLELRTGSFELPAIAGIGLWLTQNLLGAVWALFAPDRNGIAYWAHIGGFIFGMAAAELSGMLGAGIREYLFADAVSAGELGDEGLRKAINNFQQLLERKPDDSEVREALAMLAQQSQSAHSPNVHNAVSEAYAMLLEQSLSAGDTARSAEWLDALDDLDGDNVISSNALLRLAGCASKRADYLLAQRLYLKTIERFPNTEAGHVAVFEAANILLGEPDGQSETIRLLKQYLAWSRSHTADITTPMRARWRLHRSRP